MANYIDTLRRKDTNTTVQEFFSALKDSQPNLSLDELFELLKELVRHGLEIREWHAGYVGDNGPVEIPVAIEAIGEAKKFGKFDDSNMPLTKIKGGYQRIGDLYVNQENVRQVFERLEDENYLWPRLEVVPATQPDIDHPKESTSNRDARLKKRFDELYRELKNKEAACKALSKEEKNQSGITLERLMTIMRVQSK